MANPELTFGNGDSKYADSADELVWAALGLRNSDFEEEVRIAFGARRLGALARTQARLQIIADHINTSDERTAKKMKDHYSYLVEKQRAVYDRATLLQDEQRLAYEAIFNDELKALYEEQERADFPPVEREG